MPTGPSAPAAHNTYVPPDIGARLMIGFSRNAKRFHLPKYVQYTETPKTDVYYPRITTQEAARVVTQNDFEWPDAQPDTTDDGTETFNWIEARVKRYRYKFRLGDMAEQQASWPIFEAHAGIKAAQCMTARTVRMLGAATTVGNWQTTIDADNLSAHHTDTATNIAGGKLDVGTSTAPYLKIALGYIADLVNKDTLGSVDSDPESFYIVMNPNDARLIAKSQEIHDYIKGSPFAQGEIEKGNSPNGKYGLPSMLYGTGVIVENAVRVTNRKGAALARSYCIANGTILVVSKPQQLEGVYGAPSFSTLTLFHWKEDMQVESRSDSWNRLTEGRVVEHTTEQVTCPASGFLITAATG